MSNLKSAVDQLGEVKAQIAALKLRETELKAVLGNGPRRETTLQEDGNYLVTITPTPWSGFIGASSITLNPDQYCRYLQWVETGVLIQEVLPDLHPAEREILMSGIGPQQFSELRDIEDDC